MKCKQLFQGIFTCTGLFILILDGKTALEGARTGIALCLQVVIPSLFPFFVLTGLLTNVLANSGFSFLRSLGTLFGMPLGTESILLSGLLGGYPAGAQSIYSIHQSGKLSDEEAQRLLGFCNNAGPAFLFGMVAQVFPEKWQVWALWGIHIFSALLAARVFSADQTFHISRERISDYTWTDALRASVQGMATVCGWIVLFRILIAFLERWIFWLLPKELSVLLAGLLELSNGCCQLSSVMDIRLRFIFCSVMLAFGGACVTMQTLSSVGNISTTFYFRGKALQTLFSLVLSIGILYQPYPTCLACILFLEYLLRKGQKKSSIIAPLRV